MTRSCAFRGEMYILIGPKNSRPGRKSPEREFFML